MKYCLNCKSEIPIKNKYCSSRCSATFTQRHGGNVVWTNEKKKDQSELMKKKFLLGEWSPVNKQIRTKKQCLVCKKDFLVRKSEMQRKFCTLKCSRVGRDTSNMGGYRPTAGRGHQGWYKGIYCNSSWELAWVIYSLEHNVDFKRNTEGFEYEFEGKKHKYYPDFKIEGKEYLEIKGQQFPEWEAKKKQFPFTLKIILKNEMKPYLDYVTKKYGKDFVKLYE